MFGSVKVEIVGTGAKFWKVITDIGGCLRRSHFLGEKREQYRVHRLLRHFEQKEEQWGFPQRNWILQDFACSHWERFRPEGLE